MSAQEKLAVILCKRNSAKKYREQSKILVHQVQEGLRQLRQEKAAKIAAIREEFKGV